MRTVIVFLSLFFLMLTGCSPETKAMQQAEPAPTAASVTPGEIAYVGALNGDLGIHMRLKIQDGNISGSYYYDSVKTDIVLKGKTDGPQLQIQEFDANGKETATFYGAFVSPGRMEGVWTVYNPAREGHFTDLWSTIYPFFSNEAGTGEAAASAAHAEYKTIWEGTWRSPVGTSFSARTVKIAFVTEKSFWFEMYGFAGLNSRRIMGMAVMEAGRAIFRDGRGAQMTFAINDRQLTVETNDKMEYYEGAGVYFRGAYTRGEVRRPTLQGIRVFGDEEQERIFRGLTGNYYDKFVDYFQSYAESVDLDGYGAKVYYGWVRGGAPDYAGMIMVAPDGRMWAGLLTFKDRKSVIIYFANSDSPQTEMPKTMQKWVEAVEEKNAGKNKLEVIRFRQ